MKSISLFLFLSFTVFPAWGQGTGEVSTVSGPDWSSLSPLAERYFSSWDSYLAHKSVLMPDMTGFDCGDLSQYVSLDSAEAVARSMGNKDCARVLSYAVTAERARLVAKKTEGEIIAWMLKHFSSIEGELSNAFSVAGISNSVNADEFEDMMGALSNQSFIHVTQALISKHIPSDFYGDISNLRVLVEPGAPGE